MPTPQRPSVQKLGAQGGMPYLKDVEGAGECKNKLNSDIAKVWLT
ncbi:MAG: hypothetical protein ACLRXQ_12210 [Phascolarctobacterium faecium]